MLRSTNQLYGNKLGALDGLIGQVKDFYFDDQNWTIRYLVADTGTWLPGRQVLISPHSLEGLEPGGDIVRMNLTKQQIENSPPIESHKPVSQQFEEEYYQYYGWPCYWQGEALWGVSGYPSSELPPTPFPNISNAVIGPQPEREIHLRSAQAVNGYLVQRGEENIGHVCDFMMDAQSWEIGQLMIKTGHRLSGKDVLIPAKQVERISYDESIVFVHLTGEAADKIPVPAMAAAGSAS